MFGALQHGRPSATAFAWAAAAALVLIYMWASDASELTTQQQLSVALMTPYGEAALPELKLSFDEGRVELHSGARLRTDDVFLADPPQVGWWHLASATGLAPGSVYSLFFIDYGPRAEPAHDLWVGFRFVHSLWTDCTGVELTSCETAVTGWRRPGNTSPVPNRYTFLLVSHPTPLVLLGKPLGAYEPSTYLTMMDYNLTALLEENPGLTPLGLTYMAVRKPSPPA